MKWPRWLTLPKSRNSLGDLLGEDVAYVLKALGRKQIEAAVTEPLVGGVLAAERVRGDIVRAVSRALGGKVPMTVTEALAEAVGQALDDVVYRSAEEARAAVLRAVYAALGV